ncbi:MAG: 3'(2'),5'-bisphosphate nucleotidase CysQ [Anaerolineae bacterium]|nr:3'(2'),5'-bisphosphate nucleotidase CysQ [Anaerolineae bacterium]MDW8100398.1 3'(2'),5'-bisphosphate nucleotidase CysQ [Anaerolineae bacterium]
MLIPFLSHELEVARDVIRRAGAQVAAIYADNIAVEWKTVDEPITMADRVSNQIIIEALRTTFPHDGLLSEETADDGSRLSHRRVWIVDPLDGTQDFVNRTDEFAVMIGLAIDGEPALGLVYQPIADLLFIGQPGVGAWLERTGGQCQTPLQVSAIATPSQMRLVVSRSHRSPLTDAVCTALGIYQEHPYGSVGLKVSLLATSQADLYIHLSAGCKEWDVCAPHAILLAAGGQMTDCWGRPFRYNLPDVRKRWGLIASNGRIHSTIVGYVAAVCENAGVDPRLGFTRDRDEPSSPHSRP